MQPLVTHTLPASTYEHWLKFASASRFIIKNHRRISQGRAATILTYCIAKIEPDVEIHDKILTNFDEHLDQVNLVPVDPLVLLLLSFYRVMDAFENPPDQASYISTMMTMADLIAASYAQPTKQVTADLVAEFDRMDARFDTYILNKNLPPSQELH